MTLTSENTIEARQPRASNSTLAAIVIGASSGMGREIARMLAARGFRIGIAARRTQRLRELARELGEDWCVTETLDIANIPDGFIALRRLFNTLGVVDQVYLVAGTGFPNPSLNWQEEHETVVVNCLGFTAMAAETIRLFEVQGRGHLIAITSVAAVRPSSRAPAYGASKAFASAYLRALRERARKSGLPISVTEVRPGFVDTAMLKVQRPFWVISSVEAARRIVASARGNSTIVYVPRRWQLVGWLMRLLPDV